jgi:hypothetical protein
MKIPTTKILTAILLTLFTPYPPPLQAMTPATIAHKCKNSPDYKTALLNTQKSMAHSAWPPEEKIEPAFIKNVVNVQMRELISDSVKAAFLQATTWTCPICKFINQNTQEKCTMCIYNKYRAEEPKSTEAKQSPVAQSRTTILKEILEINQLFPDFTGLKIHMLSPLASNFTIRTLLQR